MSLLEDEAQTYVKNLPDYRNNRSNRRTQRQVEETSLDNFAQSDRQGRDFNVSPVVTDGDGIEPYGFSDFYDSLSELNFHLPIPTLQQLLDQLATILYDLSLEEAYFFTDTETPTQLNNDRGYSIDNKKQGVQ